MNWSDWVIAAVAGLCGLGSLILAAMGSGGRKGLGSGERQRDWLLAAGALLLIALVCVASLALRATRHSP